MEKNELIEQNIKDKKFPKIAVIYIIVFMSIEWLLQIVSIHLSGDFFNETGVNQLQGIFLTICMFIPAVVLLFFCLFKKIGFNELGLMPIKPLFWPVAFGIIVIVCSAILLSVLWFSDYPNFTNINGEWKLEKVATLIAQPNKPVVFIFNILFSVILAAIFTIPQALGEELAWRGYLQNIFIDKFGVIKGIIFLGILWGFFHLPINLAGYNYPQTPILGGLVYMTITCTSLGAIFGWIRIKSNSVWPAAAAHAAYNVVITVVEMNKPRIEINLYYLYINGIEAIIGIFFMFLIIREIKRRNKQAASAYRTERIE
jgi:membrane protease YdiL (CAAX protease family)